MTRNKWDINRDISSHKNLGHQTVNETLPTNMENKTQTGSAQSAFQIKVISKTSTTLRPLH